MNIKTRLFVLAAVTAATLPAQVTYERLLNAAEEPQNWLTYSGAYHGNRYSKLNEINPSNAADLELKWVYQTHSFEWGGKQALTPQKFEMTPLVADGVMYIVEMPNNVIALDAETGERFWKFDYIYAGTANLCCGLINRGLAILGDTLYMGTVDAKLLALDAKTGELLWEVEVADHTGGYAVTVAPLVVKDMVVVGTAGGEYGIRGYLDAYDAKTGERRWRHYIIPGPGEPGHETWEGDSWKRGGGSIWVTGSYDPELDLMYWGTGNPAPDWNPDVRKGDNLYTDSVIALDPDDGKMKWYFQFTPHDEWDWDAVQIPVLVDLELDGEMRKLMLWANRNAFYYVLDRVDGKFISGKAFSYQNWAEGLDEAGRPMKIKGMGPNQEGVKVYPSVQGATNWYSPSFSPRTGYFYFSAWEETWGLYHKGAATYTRGNRYVGSIPYRPFPAPVTNEDPGYGAVRALDPLTGEKLWEFKQGGITEAGVITTAGDVLFSGTRPGYFFALDARDGTLLWRKNLGGMMVSNPITFQAAGKQMVSIACGNSVFTFGLPE